MNQNHVDPAAFSLKREINSAEGFFLPIPSNLHESELFITPRVAYDVTRSQHDGKR